MMNASVMNGGPASASAIPFAAVAMPVSRPMPAAVVVRDHHQQQQQINELTAPVDSVAAASSAAASDPSSAAAAAASGDVSPNSPVVPLRGRIAYRSVSDETREHVCRMHRLGYTTADIADALDVPRRSAQHILRTYLTTGRVHALPRGGDHRKRSGHGADDDDAHDTKVKLEMKSNDAAEAAVPIMDYNAHSALVGLAGGGLINSAAAAAASSSSWFSTALTASAAPSASAPSANLSLTARKSKENDDRAKDRLKAKERARRDREKGRAREREKAAKEKEAARRSRVLASLALPPPPPPRVKQQQPIHAMPVPMVIPAELQAMMAAGTINPDAIDNFIQVNAAHYVPSGGTTIAQVVDTTPIRPWAR